MLWLPRGKLNARHVFDLLQWRSDGGSLADVLWCHFCLSRTQPWCLIYCSEGQQSCLSLKQSFISLCNAYNMRMHYTFRRGIHVLEQTEQGSSVDIYSKPPSITKAISSYMEMWFYRESTVNLRLHDDTSLVFWPLLAPRKAPTSYFSFHTFVNMNRQNMTVDKLSHTACYGVFCYLTFFAIDSFY